TRFSRDWSSDVCSSDLPRNICYVRAVVPVQGWIFGSGNWQCPCLGGPHVLSPAPFSGIGCPPPPHNLGRTPGPWKSSHAPYRAEEHTSELQSRENLVCRLLLEKK